MQSTYASGFLYVGALTAVKTSVCLHLNQLTPQKSYKTIILGVGAFAWLWAFSCFFVIAFQCHLPRPWETVEGSCIDIIGFWTYADIINILTDVALVILPCIILSNLQVKRIRKIIIISCFVARILWVHPCLSSGASLDHLTHSYRSVIAATIVQICFLQSKAASSQDLTFDLWTVVLVTEVVQSLSIIAACIPYLKPFMGALETGMIRANGGGVSRVNGFGYGIRSTNNQYQKYGNSKGSSKHGQSQTSDVRMDNLGFAKLEDVIVSRQTAAVSAKGQSPDSDNDSQTSQSKIIRKTVGW